MKRTFLPIFILSALISFGGFQSASAANSINITSPAGGESWTAGSTKTISWGCSGIANVDIYYKKDGGSYLIARNVSASCPNGSYNWSIPAGMPSGTYRISILDNPYTWTSDESGSFTISGGALPSDAPVLTSLSPTSGSSNITLTINGRNFNPTAANNVVGFCVTSSSLCNSDPDTIFGVSTKVSAATANSSRLTVTVPYLTTGVYNVLVRSQTTDGPQISHNTLQFTITEQCPYVFTPSGACECVPLRYDPIEGGCQPIYGTCSNQCGGGRAGTSCSSDSMCRTPIEGSGGPQPGGSQPTYSGGESTIRNPLSVNSFEELLDAFVNFIFWVGITLAPVMLIIAGFLYVTSSGSPEKVATAKRWIIWTLVGLAVVLLAKGLVAVLQSIIGVE
jgi:hypothetical protein